MTQAPRELNLELDDAEKDATEAAVEAALSGASDVLWLTVVFSLGVAWFVDHSHQQQQLAQQRSDSVEAAVKAQEQWLRRYQGD